MNFSQGRLQDASEGTESVLDSGITLSLFGNRWQATHFDYNVTPNMSLNLNLNLHQKEKSMASA